MSSGRGGAGNVRLNSGSGPKGKGPKNEDAITAFFGREISTVFQNITRSGRGGAGNYNYPMSPDKKEQEAQVFKRENMLVGELRRQGVPIGGRGSGRGGLGNIVKAPPAAGDLESQFQPSIDFANRIPLNVIGSHSSGRGGASNGAGNGANDPLSGADLERLEREEIIRVKYTASASAANTPIHGAAPTLMANITRQKQGEQASEAQTHSDYNIPYAVYRPNGRGGAILGAIASPSGSASSPHATESPEPTRVAS